MSTRGNAADERRVRGAASGVRALIVLLAAERDMVAADIAAVRRRPRALGLPFSRWTGHWLADYLAEWTGVRMSHAERPPAAPRLRRAPESAAAPVTQRACGVRPILGAHPA